MTALSEASFYFQVNRRSHDTLHKLQQCHGCTPCLCGGENLKRRGFQMVKLRVLEKQ